MSIISAMSKKILLVIIAVFTLFTFSSCENKLPTEKVDKTLFVYFPWSGNLYDFFLTNIKDLEKCVLNDDMTDCRVVIYLASSVSNGELFELRKNGKSIQRVEYKTYTKYSPISSTSLAGLLKDVKNFSPSDSYAMTVSAHGLGWLPVANRGETGETGEPFFMPAAFQEDNDLPLTRYFGGRNSSEQMNVDDFAIAIRESGVRMDFIMFDACYMANIEVAYALRDVCEYYIASPSEMLAYGMPYLKIGKPLVNGEYDKVCDEFLKFYTDFKYNETPMPYGTISVVRTAKFPAVIAAMKKINSGYNMKDKNVDDIQSLDVFRPVIFFDFKSYVDVITAGDNSSSYTELMNSLNELVPYKANTPEYYTSKGDVFPINVYSGVTVSDPSLHPATTTNKAKEQTGWHKDTH